MILTNLTILAGVYLTKRFLEVFNNDKPTSSMVIADEAVVSSKEHQDLTKISGASVLMVSAGYFAYPPLTLINVGVISYTTVPILQRTIKTLYHDKKITNDGYSALISILTLGTGNYCAASVHNLIYHASGYLVDQSRESSTHSAANAYQKTPDKVWIVTGSVEREILLDELAEGDIIIVTTGEVIPVDGVISTGIALVDQQAMTGEANPVEKGSGDEVMASTIVLSGRIGIISIESGHTTRINKLNELLQKTHDYKTQLQLKGEAWSDRVAFPMIACSSAIVPFFGITPALALLFSAPCNTVRSMLSVQTSAHMQWITERGVLIKDGSVLEELPHIDTILFDKTGTLTEAQPEVAAIIPSADLDERTLLRLAATAEQRQEHPIARAIVNKAHQLQLTLPEVEESQYDLGLGVSATSDGQFIQVGSQRFVQEASDNFELPDDIETAMHKATNHTFIFIAINGVIKGAIELYPRIRQEIPELITTLRQREFKSLTIVSGDLQTPTEKLANTLNMDAAYGEVLPHDKAALVRKLQTQGRRVCFVGDGINDAIAMKQANVSVSLNSASNITRDIAQIVMLNDTLAPLDSLFDMAAGLNKELSHSLYFWIGFGAVNAAAVPLLAFGPLQSSLFYGASYLVGLQQSKRIGSDVKRIAQK